MAFGYFIKPNRVSQHGLVDAVRRVLIFDPIGEIITLLEVGGAA